MKDFEKYCNCFKIKKVYKNLVVFKLEVNVGDCRI